MDLKPGEVICDKCNGEGKFGHVIEFTEFDYRGHSIKVPGFSSDKICEKCLGTGKLDWVEVVVGKKPMYKNMWVDDNDINSMYPNMMG